MEDTQVPPSASAVKPSGTRICDNSVIGTKAYELWVRAGAWRETLGLTSVH